MKKLTTTLSGALLIAALSPATWAEEGVEVEMAAPIELPGIPLRALTSPQKQTSEGAEQQQKVVVSPVVTADPNQVRQLQKTALQAKREFDADYRLNDRKPLELVVKPGVNTLITVSKGRLNRLVTPFQKPVIRTVSDIEVLQENNIIYTVTNSQKPVSMFITDQEGGQALSLTLIPKAIPPREVRMGIDYGSGGTVAGMPYSSKAAKTTERSKPYVDSVTKILSTVALGDVPEGYTLRHPVEADFEKFFCETPHISSNLGQVLDGGDWQLGIMAIKNETNSVIEFVESDCLGYNRLAIAAYPSAVIKPRGNAELYILRKKDDVMQQRNRRPYLHLN